MPRLESIDKVVGTVANQMPVIEGFGQLVEAVLTRNSKVAPIIHSFKRRAKSMDSLKDKIANKRKDGDLVDSKNVFKYITDLYGVRLIHLFPQDISVVHSAIYGHVSSGDWVLAEKPKAYTWDPESKEYLSSLGLACHLKPSYYTSVHYLVKPKKQSTAVCEIQVRSLLEEVWAEIEHKKKYKANAMDPRVVEHLGVLARLVGAGSKLVSALHQSAG